MQPKSSRLLFIIPILTLTFVFALSQAQAFEAGARVLGQWSDGLWYPARVATVSGDQYQVNFDDGDVATLGKGKIKKVDWQVGSRLQCNWKNAGKYYPGKIQSMDGERIHMSYDDGDQEKITISRCRSK